MGKSARVSRKYSQIVRDKTSLHKPAQVNGIRTRHMLHDNIQVVNTPQYPAHTKRPTLSLTPSQVSISEDDDQDDFSNTASEEDSVQHLNLDNEYDNYFPNSMMDNIYVSSDHENDSEVSNSCQVILI